MKSEFSVRREKAIGADLHLRSSRSSRGSLVVTAPLFYNKKTIAKDKAAHLKSEASRDLPSAPLSSFNQEIKAARNGLGFKIILKIKRL